MNFIKSLFTMNDDSTKVGLSQFKQQAKTVSKPNVSITTKNVKLSDLMRRVS